MFYLFAFGILIIAAVAQVLAAASSYRRSPSAARLSFLIYLLLWDIMEILMFVFLAYVKIMPKSSRLGFYLFLGILSVLIHGFTAVFFADFLWKWRGRFLSWNIKILMLLPFLGILADYTLRAVRRLASEPAPESFQVTAPFSGKLMLLLVAAALGLSCFPLARRRTPGRERDIRRYIAITGLALAANTIFSLVFVSRWLQDFRWRFFLAGLAALAVNIPGILILRRTAGGPISLSAAPDSRGFQNLRGLADRFGLSPRETEITAHLLDGRENREIAAEFFISPETVKKHVSNIYHKLGVKNRLQLMNRIMRDGPDS